MNLAMIKNNAEMQQQNIDSEFDLQSDTTSSNAVALVDETTIKDLIEEFNIENNNMAMPKSK